MDGALLLAGGAALLSAMGAWESWRHRRFLQRIPVRIHVNGTRGKSSVTRLIAAGLRAGGIRTCAKTTGTLPRMIFPDGVEYPVFRPMRSNVIEQLRVIRAAAECQAEALVIECMALQPQLQALCELDIVRSTHGVITNARADHLDVMGPTPRDVAKAMAATTPVRGKLFTADKDYLDVFQESARDRGSSFHAIGDDDIARVDWTELANFTHIEHPDNVALALAVCRDLGVDRQTALRGMWKAIPDAGVMSMFSLQESGKQLTLVNGFAANDPDSTGKNWNMVVDRLSGYEKRIALFNCRADRVDRSVQLADACLQWKPADRYVLIGEATEAFARRAVSRGLDAGKVVVAEKYTTERLVAEFHRSAERSAMIMGMGNIYGPGMDLVEYFRGKAERPKQEVPLPDQVRSDCEPYGELVPIGSYQGFSRETAAAASRDTSFTYQEAA